ncbi:MAG TPA: bifunctional methylenetetrahydrofolate dehydrogenase/methenyltetrahydrofolate cyclohydrolase FolD [Stellaceae bacterium]|nr:bifunctional methylenetetrahydrofolate dehydrogenase/methenyltetrahydrofolate cyclohydrolase FolD [Stellaceae bacterium]
MSPATSPITTRLIDGKALASDIRAEVAAGAAAFVQRHGQPPGLAVVLVGEDPASAVYVRNKGKETLAAGMRSFEHKLPAETSEGDLLDLVRRLNADPNVHGILVQLPLPRHIDAEKVIATIDPAKDVDGFHVVNAGKLAVGLDGMVPCTPLGCLMMLKRTLGELVGLNAVIVGRSNIVGKPMAALLLRESCTVTIAHSKSRDLPDICRRADIVVAAVGRPQMVKGDWIKPGACVIDVGINRIEKPDGGTRLVGDADWDSLQGVAGAATPVPGGVGPMTIACLLANTLTAARRQLGETV